MKEFKAEHLFFPDCINNFTEENPPNWVIIDDGWWWKGHVLTLNVGKSIESDFQKITRTK